LALNSPLHPDPQTRLRCDHFGCSNQSQKFEISTTGAIQNGQFNPPSCLAKSSRHHARRNAISNHQQQRSSQLSDGAGLRTDGNHRGSAHGSNHRRTHINQDWLINSANPVAGRPVGIKRQVGPNLFISTTVHPGDPRYPRFSTQHNPSPINL